MDPCIRLQDEGNVLIMSVVLVALLIATGMGYMSWSSDERWDTAYERATVQAYFLAQTGLIEQGLIFLKTRKPTELPAGVVHLDPGVVEGVGMYYNTKVVRLNSLSDGNVFQRNNTYDIFSTGRTEFVNHQLGNRFYGEKKQVERTSKLRARLRSFANYMYLTDKEKTSFNEIIWFWEEDSLYGRVHSNDYIGIKRRPHFFGPVSTSKEKFEEIDSNPYFKYEPQFNVPKVLFPTEASTLRAAASPRISGTDANGREMMTRVWFRGADGIWIYQYPWGSTPPDLYGHSRDDLNLVATLTPPSWGAIFINGQAEIYGEVNGAVSIGTAGDMWLVDDVKYEGAEDDGEFDYTSMPHMLGLVSESNIIIQDNPWNGSENGFNRFPNNTDRHSIVINAGLVALGESFTFEHQNDDWESYQGPAPDERGDIHLWGAVTQVRRGYVHRSNHDGTGYGKDYHYDFRFDERPPPFYLEALDENGHGLFDIISWGELAPTEL